MRRELPSLSKVGPPRDHISVDVEVELVARTVGQVLRSLIAEVIEQVVQVICVVDTSHPVLCEVVRLDNPGPVVSKEVAVCQVGKESCHL